MSSSVAGEEVLAGEVAHVVYADDNSGFGVVEVVCATGDRPTARATGPLGRLVEGQPVALHGRWTTHPRYGETFVVAFYRSGPAQTTAGLQSFLASEHFPGIGRRLAAGLVDAFGLTLPEVVVSDPSALLEVPGITQRLATVVVDGWRRAGALGALVTRLAGAGIPAGPARWLVQRYGDDAAAQLDSDPYVVLAAPGVGWRNADRLARAERWAVDDDRRLVAAAVSAVRQRRARAGDVVIDASVLVVDVHALLGGDAALASRAVTTATDAGALVAWDGDHGEQRELAADAAAEQRIAEIVLRLHTESTARAVDDAQIAAIDPALTAEQRAAVAMTFAHAVSVLTGGPGTGKTRTVAAVLGCADQLDLRVALCAPTGRAARRLEELAGHRATTIHRLLEARPEPGDGDGFVFGYDATRRLPHDLVVADEWSMADLGLARALLSALPDGGRVLLVGDVDQLPPVGPGAVLRDLLTVAALDGPVAAATLRTVHRQAARSRIITLAHELKDGTGAAPPGRDNDVFSVAQPTRGLAERIAEIVAVRAPDYFDCTPADVQVLAPQYAGPAGVDRINEVLRDRLNPRGGRSELRGFCEGDRVVATRNDAELDVANGEVGEVTAVDLTARTLEVAFATGVVTYGAREIRDLRPAWCLTVHKAQGGQWRVVVLVLDPTHRRMLWRELVYTAVTRAVDGLLLVGHPGLLASAASRTGSGIATRSTTLAQRLSAAVRVPDTETVGVP